MNYKLATNYIKKTLSTTTIFLLLIITGCKKEILGDGYTTDYQKNFDYLWKEFNQHYAFFDLHQVNWDSIYNTYQPQTKNLRDDYQFLNLLDSMLANLKDGHVNVYSPVGQTSYPYAPSDYYSGNGSYLYTTHPDYSYETLFPATILTKQTIGYIAINTFQGKTSSFDTIHSLLKNFGLVDGFIIDVRANTGGASNNADKIAAPFINQKALAFTSRYKNGFGKNDFTAWIAEYCSPNTTTPITKPVAVLTNRLTYSSAEWFVLKMKSQPNICQIGDTTGGGSGNPLQRELPNGWTFRFSNSQKRMTNGIDYQGIGIPPDIAVTLSENDLNSGTDPIIERALEWIKETSESNEAVNP